MDREGVQGTLIVMRWMMICVLLVGSQAAAEEAPPSPTVTIPVDAQRERDALAASIANDDPEARLDEDEAFKRVRSYDRRQLQLFGLEMGQADQYRKAGQEEQADALALQARGRAEAVRGAYEALLDKYPENARATTHFGELLYDYLGDQEGAVNAWLKAEKLDKKLALPLNNLALHFCHVGAYPRGLNYLERTLKMDPDHPDYLYNAAQMYLVHFPEVEKAYGWSPKKIYKRAMKCSKRAAEVKPEDYELVSDYAVNFFAAENFGLEADWRGAAEAWQAARKQARSGDEVFYTWLNEARAWIAKEDLGRAQACLDEAVRLHPDSTAARNLLERVKKLQSE
ncbi:MAG: hypothetical protein GY851_07265 [bacterium]|nr:hypothetical protein [bacterium]